MICIRSVILHGSIETTSLLYQVVISSCLRACFYTNIKRDVLRDRPSNIISDQTFTVSFLFRRETSFFTVPGTRLERIIHPIVVRRGKNWKRNRILFDVDEHVAHRETGSGKPEARPLCLKRQLRHGTNDRASDLIGKAARNCGIPVTWRMNCLDIRVRLT